MVVEESHQGMFEGKLRWKGERSKGTITKDHYGAEYGGKGTAVERPELIVNNAVANFMHDC